jgi:hypothetical protein
MNFEYSPSVGSQPANVCSINNLSHIWLLAMAKATLESRPNKLHQRSTKVPQGARKSAPDGI